MQRDMTLGDYPHGPREGQSTMSKTVAKRKNNCFIRPLSWVSLILAAAPMTLNATEEGLISPPVVAESKPVTGIVLPKEPTAAERHAANELCNYVKKMTGATLPVIEEDQSPPGGRLLLVGRTRAALQAHNPDTWLPDTISIGYAGNDIAIVGQGMQGTLFAVYEFLRDQGCRWYVPGAEGEHIPRLPELTLAVRPRTYTPSFRRRGWVPPPAPPRVWETLYYDWAVRNGLNALTPHPITAYPPELGYGLADRDGHTLSVLIPCGDHPRAKETFAAHPDWYPQIDGKRICEAPDGGTVQACLSNAEVAQEVARQVIEYFQQNPRCSLFWVGLNDCAFCCECDHCLATDGPGSTWKKNDVYDAYPQRSKSGPGPMSSRFVRFVNRVAQIVAKSCPGKDIGLLAYGSTVAPPRSSDWELESNIVVVYAYGDGVCFRHRCADSSCVQNALMGEWLRGWARHGNPIYVWDYPPQGIYLDAPTGVTSSYQDYVLCLKKMGVAGWCGEGQGAWAGSALCHYLKARLLWDVDTDVNILTDEFCDDLYGPAAADMKEYYRAFENALKNHPDHVTYGSWVSAMDANAVAYLDRCLEKAGTTLRDGNQPAVKRQWAMARVAMDGFILQWQELNAADKKVASFARKYESIRESCRKLIEEYQIEVTSAMTSRVNSHYRPPFEALSGEELLTLPLQWRFRTDPNQEGIQAGYPFARDWDKDSWQAIKIGESWTTQGFPFHGTAWYATRIEIPLKFKERLWLLFGAIDGDAEVWIDGRKAGEFPLHPYDNYKGTDITSLVAPGRPSLLVLRVSKDLFAAGITKPVRLMEGAAKDENGQR
jgi:hypothetical protein